MPDASKQESRYCGGCEERQKMLDEAVELLGNMNSEYKWAPVAAWLSRYRAALPPSAGESNEAGGGE